MAIKGGITLLQKLQKLYGARAVTDRLGRTTNVQTLAQGTNNPFALEFSKKYLKKNPDGVEEASRVIMENMQFAFGNKNAQQMKNFEANVNTLYDMKFPPAKAEAEILDLSTKKQVTGKGIDYLKEKMGLPEGVEPNSPLGKIVTNQNRAKKYSENQARQYSANIESYRRPIIRQMLLKDTRINLPDNVRKSLESKMDLSRGADPKMDPLRLLNEYYDVDFAKLDELEDIRFTARNETEAANEFLKKGGLKPKKPIVRESLDDEAVEMAEQSDLDDDIPFAQGGRVSYGKGDLVTKGIPALKKLIKDKFGKKSITTADKIKQPQSALDRKMFEDFNQRNIKLSYADKDKRMIPEGLTEEDIDFAILKGEFERKYSKLIPEDLMRKIMADDDPQRVKDIIGHVEQAAIMADKGMSSDQIIDAFKAGERTKQADGGRVSLKTGGLLKLYDFLKSTFKLKKKKTQSQLFEEDIAKIKKEMEIENKKFYEGLEPGGTLEQNIEKSTGYQFPEIGKDFRKKLLEKIGNRKDNILKEFDTTGRKPNAQGGIAGQLHLNRTGYDIGGAAGTELAITQSLKDFKRYKKAGGKLSYKDFIASGNEGVSRFFNQGGRVGLEKGGPPNPGRRNFMKLMAGLASLPIVGKLFKGAKVASKVVPLKNTTTTMPAWFPDLVDKFIAKGVRNKIDEDMIEYSVKELPDVKMVERTDGMISVEGKNAYNEDYFIQYEPPGYTVVDEKTGKAVKTPGEFVATDTEYRMVSPEDYDIDGVTVDNVDELLGGSSNQLEGFAKGTGKTKYTTGQRRIDEADARGASKDESLRADVNDPYEGMDGSDFVDEDYAKGGLAGQLKL